MLHLSVWHYRERRGDTRNMAASRHARSLTASPRQPSGLHATPVRRNFHHVFNTKSKVCCNKSDIRLTSVIANIDVQTAGSKYSRLPQSLNHLCHMRIYVRLTTIRFITFADSGIWIRETHHISSLCNDLRVKNYHHRKVNQIDIGEDFRQINHIWCNARRTLPLLPQMQVK